MTVTEPIEVSSAEAGAPAAAPVPAVVVEPQRNAAIEAAAEAALAMPGVPGRDEFLTLAMTAKMISLSGAAPEAVRNNPYVAFHVAMVGRDLGISPSAAIQLIDVIPGRNGSYELSLSPQLLNGQIRRLGLGQILKKRVDMNGCVAVAVGPTGIDRRCRLTWRDDKHAADCNCDILGESEFTWEDAQAANLAGDKCQPHVHAVECSNRDSAKRLKCNQGYITYWKRMSWWRAGGFAADDYFPEAGLGLYSPEELGAAVDEEGRPIDPTTVALPDGYEQKQVGAAAAETVSDDERWQLQLRIMVLPDAQRAELNETWKKSDKVGKVADLTASSMKIAQAIVTGAESKARTADRTWSTAAALETLARSIVAALLPAWADRSTDSPHTPPPSGQAQPETPADADRGADTETAPETAPVAPTPPSSARKRGETAIEPTEADLEGASPKLINEVITEVLAMKAPAVDTALTDMGLHVQGELDQRKHRLSLAMIRDAKAADQP